MPVINDQARVYSFSVNGNEYFYYHGKTMELNAALANFAKIEAKHHVVVFRSGPAVQPTFKKNASIVFNWQLHVLGPIAKHKATHDPEDFSLQKWPVLTVQVDDDIDLEQLVIPPGITVRTVTVPAKGTESADAVRRKLETFLGSERR